MIRIVFIACLFFLLPLSFAQAQEGEALVVDLAQDHVDITTGFNGARLVLFGVKKAGGDIAVVISGPKKRMVVRRKDRVAGAWMNRQSVEFRDALSYYDYALGASEETLAPTDVLDEHGIGLDSLSFTTVSKEKPEVAGRFHEALIRNQQSEGLYPLSPNDIVYLSDTFFRTSLDLPSNVPMGEYTIRTFYIRDQKIEDIQTTSLKVAQVGLGSQIYLFAHGHSLAYGLLAVAIAVFAGWAANTFLRRE